MRRNGEFGDGDRMSKHIETVQSIYAAFGRGDGPAVLAHISEDVNWEYQYVTPSVPWLTPKRTRAGVGEFLQSTATELEFHAFVPKHFLATGNIVVALCDVNCTVVKTGKKIIETDEPHIWHFDDRGKVIKFRHAADTHQQFLAFTAQG